MQLPESGRHRGLGPRLRLPYPGTFPEGEALGRRAFPAHPAVEGFLAGAGRTSEPALRPASRQAGFYLSAYQMPCGLYFGQRFVPTLPMSRSLWPLWWGLWATTWSGSSGGSRPSL